jgi:uncharacterized protein (DUF433 family)
MATQFARITHNPAVMGGKPCIRGLRITVETIVGLLASGESRERILQAYPYLEPAELDKALAYMPNWSIGHSEHERIQVDVLSPKADDCGLRLGQCSMSRSEHFVRKST